MAEQDNKERKVLYGEENNGDSIAATGGILAFLLILGAIANGAQIVMLLSENNISAAELILRLAGIVIMVVLAIRLSKAMSALGQLVEENARLKTAVQYLFETHNIEVHSFDETPTEVIPGGANDGFETMRIEADGVHFRKAGARVKCPFCDREQPVGTDYCLQCGQRFFFEE
jgi:hypothetical protein